MKIIILNNFKVLGTFIGSLTILMIIMWVLWGLSETNIMGAKVYDVMVFLVSLLLLAMHNFLGRKFLKSSGNMAVDTLSFVLIIVIVIFYIKQTSSGTNSGNYNVYLTHYKFLEPFLGDHIARIGVGVILSCIAQYVGLLCELIRGS